MKPGHRSCRHCGMKFIGPEWKIVCVRCYAISKQYGNTNEVALERAANRIIETAERKKMHALRKH